jgi:DNA-binding Xre family transcriptional regulator
MTYSDLSDMINVGERTISLWATGKNVPSALMMDEVCVALMCDLSDIYPLITETE